MVQDMDSDTYASSLVPFYEQWISKIPGPVYLKPLLVSIPFLFGHALLGLSFGVNVFLDLSWMLSIMIGGILMLVIIATRRLRVFLDRIYEVFYISSENPVPEEIIRNVFSTKTMLSFGVFFGGVNSLLGIFYGIWYQEPFLIASLLIQFFVIGGVCGFAISGIYGVLKLVRYAVEYGAYSLEVTACDQCGGMSRVGSNLLEFALVSLIGGLLIAYYVYNSPWSNTDWTLVMYAIYFWMGFPHLAAIVVVSVPLLQLHKVLAAEKNRKVTAISNERRNLREELLTKLTNSNQVSEDQVLLLNTKYSILSELSNEVNAIREWPFNMNSGVSFSLTYLITLAIPLLELWQSLSGLLAE